MTHCTSPKTSRRRERGKRRRGGGRGDFTWSEDVKDGRFLTFHFMNYSQRVTWITRQLGKLFRESTISWVINLPTSNSILDKVTFFFIKLDFGRQTLATFLRPSMKNFVLRNWDKYGWWKELTKYAKFCRYLENFAQSFILKEPYYTRDFEFAYCTKFATKCEFRSSWEL